MQTSAKPSATDRRDFVVIPSDQVRVAPSDAEITDLLRAAARQHSETEVRAALEADAASVPAVDATFRATAVNEDLPARGPSFGRRLMRAIAALLVAAGITGVALTWQTFGYAAKKALLSWAPKWAIVASLPLDKIGVGKESSPSDQPADATAAPAADAPAQSTADSGTPDNAAASATAPSSDGAQQLQSMARDLASANQQIETLKASIAELKAGQQQMARDLAKATEKASDKLAEQNARAKTAAVGSPRPAAAPHRPAPAYSPTATYSPSPAAAPPPAYRPAPSSYSAQASVPPPPAAAQPNVPPPIPLQPQADPGVTSVPRPPMPVQ